MAEESSGRPSMSVGPDFENLVHFLEDRKTKIVNDKIAGQVLDKCLKYRPPLL